MHADPSRRRFCQSLGLGAAALAAGAPSLARAQQSDAWMSEFLDATQAAPWTLGFVTPEDRLVANAVKVEGRFPEAVRGTLFRNGPAGHDLGGVRYHHWFDGDGMLQRFRIGADSVDHFGKYIDTDKFVAESQRKQRLVEAFGTKLPDRIPVTSGDSLNAANTSVLPFHGSLLALWEGGSAVEVDAETLEARGVKTWRDEFRAMPFSAHPRVDQDGTIWNFGVGSGYGLLMLYQIGADGVLVRGRAIKVADVPMIHDFVITKTKLVFLMPPLVFDAQRFRSSSFLDAHVWRPELAMRVLVIDKNDWDQQTMFELPPAFLFHLGNGWEDERGTIRLDYVHADEPDSLFIATREVMRGRFPESPVPRLARVTLDMQSRQAHREVLPVEAEFPRIDPRLTGLRHRTVVHATSHPLGRPGFTAIAVTDIDTGHSQQFDYGADHMVEEHLYVPDRAGAGWVLGTSLDLKRQSTQLACFAADRIGAGPVALARLPYALPLGFHGNLLRT